MVIIEMIFLVVQEGISTFAFKMKNIYTFKVRCTYKHVTVVTVVLLVPWSDIQCLTVCSSRVALR